MADDFDAIFDDDDDESDEFFAEPLPAELNYVDMAARQIVRPEWIGHPPWKPPPLSKSHLKLLAQVFKTLDAPGQTEKLNEWLYRRMSEEAHSKGKLDPVGGRVYGLVMLILVLAEAGVEPFALIKTSNPSNSKRVEYNGPSTPCEATEADAAQCALPTKDPDRPYLLSHAAADRLEHRCLSPIEWYRLVVRHGRHAYHLWPDCYGNDGTPFQAMFAVKKAPSDNVPTFEEVRDNLRQLLDFVQFKLQLDEEFREQSAAMTALARFGRAAIESELDLRLAERPVAWVDRMCWRVRVGLEYIDEARLESRWAQAAADAEALQIDLAELARDSISIIGAAATIDHVIEIADLISQCPDSSKGQQFIAPHTFACALQDSMGADMLLELVFALLDRLPADRLPDQVLHTFNRFREERVLDWIERNAREPIEYQWGTAAAVNGMSWDRAKDWLVRGRPLSLVALDAMKNCRGYDEQDGHMSGVFRDYSPKVAGRPKLKDVRNVLSAFAKTDPDERVRDSVVVILANLENIFGE